MKVYYHSKKVPTTDMWGTPTMLHGNDGKWIHATIVSPRTGRKFGYIIEDDCGSMIVKGPTFIWPLIAKAVRGEVCDLVTLAMRQQQWLNDRYCDTDA